MTQPHAPDTQPRFGDVSVLVDTLWCLMLATFVLIGLPITSFHGDEVNHMRNSEDYWTLFVAHNPTALLLPAEVNIWQNDDAHYRLLDSTVTRYSIGFFMHLLGFDSQSPPDAGYIFNQSHEQNRGYGLVPDQNAMIAARLGSAVWFALSAAVIFALGRLIGGRDFAYLISLLYTINPVLLLNGRRALQEGPLLFFGLFTVYIAIMIAIKRERGEPTRPLHWVGLAVLAGLTQASKNNGFLFILAAFVTIAVSEIVARGWTRPTVRQRVISGLGVAARLIACGVFAVLIFYVLSPGLWADPVARLADMVKVRYEAMVVQIDIDPNAPTTVEHRIIDAAAASFIAPVAHYELALGPVSESLIQQYTRYNQSPLSGWHMGVIIGGFMTLCAVIGLVATLVLAIRKRLPKSAAVGVWVYLTINIVFLLNIWLPWQRYAIPLIPGVIVCAGLGLVIVGRVVSQSVRHPSAPTIPETQG